MRVEQGSDHIYYPAATDGVLSNCSFTVLPDFANMILAKAMAVAVWIIGKGHTFQKEQGFVMSKRTKLMITVFCLISAFFSATNAVRSNCPIACVCKNVSGKIQVDCRTHYWKRLPDISKGTGIIYVEKSKFGILQSPSSCENYRELTKLTLKSCGITAVKDDAFKCMSGLLQLNLDRNCLKTFSSAATSHLVNLNGLTISRNELQEEMIPNLCTLQYMYSLNLSRNKLQIAPRILDCLGHLKHLRHIDLSHNVINGSLKLKLKPLANIATIVAGSCKISALEEGAFSGFKASRINLQYNYIKVVHRHAFVNATNLQYLTMSGNPISGSSEWITELPALKELHLANIGLFDIPTLPKTVHFVDLSGNTLSNLTEHSFHGLNELEHLIINGAKIQEIENNSFSNLPSLKILTSKSAGLNRNMLPNVFWGLANSSLEVLNLSGNPVRRLSKTTFEFFVPNKLKNLSLKNCLIKVIQSKTFENLKHLERLILSDNLVCEVEAHAFSGLERLSYLDLKDNHLSELNSRTIGISGSPLKKLRLFGNFFKKYSFESLLGLEGLEDLDLGGNRITSIKSKVGLFALKHLGLFDNKIGTIEPGVFSSFTNLTSLRLGRNALTQNSLGVDSLQNMENLEILSLSDTYLGNEESATINKLWANNHKLKILELRNCRITTLVPNMFSSLRSLEILSLNINYISSVDPSAFTNATTLRDLGLDRNRITVVNWKSFVNLPNLQKLSLAGNPLLCTCESLWIFQKIKSQELYIPKKIKKYTLQCKPAGEFHFKELHFEVTDCEEPWALILKPVAIGLSAVLGIFGMYLLWYYRWHIRYTLFLARAGRHRYIEMQENTEYKYDAFVAYSSPDLPWVKQNLLPNVDTIYFGPEGFRLCLHHRDWLVGEDITENIRKSIVESRRTIVVLSKAFAESYWCKFELAMAHMRLDAEGHGKNRLLVILLDDIPAHLLTAHLRHILTTKTYITWPQEPALQQCFWKAIRKSLKKQLFYE